MCGFQDIPGDALADEQRKFLRRFVLVVAPAAQDDILDRWWAAGRIGHYVVKLQASAFRAPAGGDERALPAIARPDHPPHRRGNVARSGGESRTRVGPQP
jgi:hypothetical protein